MQNQFSQDSEKDLNIKELFYYLLSHSVKMIALALVFAVALGAFGVYKETKRMDDHQKKIAEQVAKETGKQEGNMYRFKTICSVLLKENTTDVLKTYAGKSNIDYQLFINKMDFLNDLYKDFKELGSLAQLRSMAKVKYLFSENIIYITAFSENKQQERLLLEFVNRYAEKHADYINNNFSIDKAFVSEAKTLQPLEYYQEKNVDEQKANLNEVCIVQASIQILPVADSIRSNIDEKYINMFYKKILNQQDLLQQMEKDGYLLPDLLKNFRVVLDDNFGVARVMAPLPSEEHSVYYANYLAKLFVDYVNTYSVFEKAEIIEPASKDAVMVLDLKDKEVELEKAKQEIEALKEFEIQKGYFSKRTVLKQAILGGIAGAGLMAMYLVFAFFTDGRIRSVLQVKQKIKVLGSISKQN